MSASGRETVRHLSSRVMGLMVDLGYVVSPQSGLRRRFVEVAAHEPLATFISKTATPLDRWMFKLSSGRVTSTALLTGFPVLWVTTIGAKSGQRREVPLLGIPTPDANLALFGTNFGQSNTPGWVHNIRANPDVEIGWRDTATKATADLMSVDAAEPVWDTAAAAYPNYANYRKKAAHRSISVFELRSI